MGKPMKCRHILMQIIVVRLLDLEDRPCTAWSIVAAQFKVL